MARTRKAEKEAVSTAGAVVAAATSGQGQANGGAEATDPLHVMMVDPDLILTDPDIKALREWSGQSRQELSLPELARSIWEEGQFYPCIVRETPDGYMMVEGERRRQAVSMIRAEGDEQWGAGAGELALRVLVREIDEHQALRIALLSFTQREDLTPIEFAKSIKLLRQRFHAAGADGTSFIAEFLGVSPATVTQAERLLKLPDAVQADVQAGRITASAALELAVTPPEKQAEVMQVAQEIAGKEAKKNGKNGKNGKRKQKAEESAVGPSEEAVAHASEAELDIISPAAEEPAAAPAPPPAKVQGKHVRAAQRKVAGALTTPKAPKMAESIAMFEELEKAAVGVLKAFAVAYGKWAHGKVKDESLVAAWEDVADALFSAKSKKQVKPAAKPVVKAKAKAKPKPRAKAKAKK